jgi:hypothetical protein
MATAVPMATAAMPMTTAVMDTAEPHSRGIRAARGG